ncbi:hypothetical protein BJF80_07480 [Serinicoccus sp. CUA-874]|uniref:NAD(P)-binding domain-containing protein n=1 Tax=Serinicoccus sp. CUA-874 TaxID=1517939 RepID=UPI00095DE6E1|nr:NAD(P)-binding domain-containing protein [Serinicoccus sp. CUA-874]OLT16384.1 hypothetical protein BJF80_07480 [Serinicoccus sp. CUA-874]
MPEPTAATDSPTIGILGTGSLAAAIVRGLCEGVDDAPPILLSPRGERTSARLAAAYPDVTVAADNQAVVDGADTVLVCLRQDDAGLLGELTWRPEQSVVSAVAGLTAPALAEAVAPATEVARAVPVVGVATRSWSTPLRPALPGAVAVFERTGGVLPVEDDEQFDAIFTALGTVAPLFDYLAAIEGFLRDHGLPAGGARTLLGQNVALALAPHGVEPEPDFAELRREHAPAGGGNEQMATLLAQAGVPEATRAALDEVFRRQTGGAWE